MSLVLKPSDDSTPRLQVLTCPAPHLGHITVLLLNLPETRNALSRDLISSLASQVSQITAENGNGPTRAVVIASALDNAFCSGADLKERKNFTVRETQAFLKSMRDTFQQISNLRIPTITAIASLALGGGLELSLTTHFRVFGASAVVAQPETLLAIIPGAGGTYRLPSLIGLNRARDLILTGRRVTGIEAYSLGLCDRYVEIDPEELQQEGEARKKVLNYSLELARDLCQGAPIALKQALNALHNWQTGETAEHEAYEKVLNTADRREALVAFAEKRTPVFKGE